MLTRAPASHLQRLSVFSSTETRFPLNMAGPKTVRIVEVGPRDGLQNVKTVVDTSTKLELIQRLQGAGLQNIEITSVVSPKAIPQLADCRKILSAPVVKRWQQTDGTLRMPVLVPNTKGFRIALEHGVREVAVFVSATEGFSRANINCTVDESLERAKQVAAEASAAGVLVRGYVSCIFADPFDGPTPLPAVSRAVRSLLDMGCYEALAKPNDSRAGAALASKSKISSTKSSSKITDRRKEALGWSVLQQSDNIVVRGAGANGNIVLNKPRNGNTLTFPMISEIIQAFKSFESDASISRILISANGKFFCTGMDLSQAAQAVGRGGDASSKLFQALTDLFELIDKSPKVTIACIQGPAFGGGIGLAFACDIRISISSASFTLSEAKLGMCPAVISKYVIREWGFGLSREAMLTARSLTASELKSAGAISMVAETPSELDIITKTLLAQLRHSSPGGSSMSKELVKLSWRHAGKPEQRDGISRLFKTMMEPGSDAVHGIAEFQQKPLPHINVHRSLHFEADERVWGLSNYIHYIISPCLKTVDNINMAEPAESSTTRPERSPESRSPPTTAGIKRIRQACTSCRQKKIKCSGDRPRCINCRRVMQRCQYEPYSAVSASLSGNSTALLLGLTKDTDLLQRISMIESKLAQLSDRESQEFSSAAFNEANLPMEDHNTVEEQPQFQLNEQEDVLGVPDLVNQSSPNISTTWRSGSSQSQTFSTFPPDSVTQSLVDTFFQWCHNQPYSYFHEGSFRQKLADGQLSKCVLLAVLASSLRFSEHEYYRDNRSNAIEAYAREAWLSVLGDHMTVEDSCNLEVAQATNILAIIDFTAGRTSSAWLKIGMAIRIAQDLQLMKEPSETLPLVEQEERRRSFWSIYLLDKLVSLGKHRHFAILDEDCHVRLPCDELTFRSGGWGQNVTLRQLLDWSTDVGVESGFPVAILASSVLARCTRRLLHDRNTDDTPPWDSKSEFASITSLLLLVESRLQVDQHPIKSVVDTYRLDDGIIDHPAMGHVIFARTVFHVCYCLLYHPFLVREQIRKVKCQVPSSFMRLASQKSYEHARDLVNLLHDAEAVGCHLGASFYAYSVCLAGSILSLHMHAEKDTESQRYLELLSATQDSISILEGMAKFWDHASKIHHRLLTFNSNAYLFDSLLDSQLKSVMDPGWERSLWSMVDYGEMCRESNLSIPSPKIPAPSDSPSFPDLGLESEQMLDMGLGVQQISQIDDNLMNFDTPNIKYLLELASGGG
ncbi:3-hydroxymethyl-3-methylglutaryl-CoA lyase [Colletotrichum scovillei]|uniref:3-hydroxymethyl-3-methylglutaryl-CoA lyase n=1 Tax=Colletotrichum scovillei TaxID=1209932 RepID=A0A9P7QX47_9PEZI|nr:3-hydroxymethyl-3-methylglutaryl-CoA lyase [Colletotrichum scovillei]KAG7064245.1 3-hydroxymethyl-3-methylglutaryl-CoA lyase [Colletotrichum scovillei]